MGMVVLILCAGESVGSVSFSVSEASLLKSVDVGSVDNDNKLTLNLGDGKKKRSGRP